MIFAITRKIFECQEEIKDPVYGIISFASVRRLPIRLPELFKDRTYERSSAGIICSGRV